MTEEIWEWDDLYRVMTEDEEVRKKRERKQRERKHLGYLLLFCAVMLAIFFLATVGPGDAAMGG